MDCVSRVVSHYARYDHSVLARHRDLGLNQTTRDISPSQLSDKLSPKISDSLSTTQAPPGPKFSSTRIFPSKAVDKVDPAPRFATFRAENQVGAFSVFRMIALKLPMVCHSQEAQRSQQILS